MALWNTPLLSAPGADDEHLDKILEAAAGLPFISAIILVANGSVARETITIKNVFTLLRGHMPDAVLENTLAVLTNCSSITRCAFESEPPQLLLHECLSCKKLPTKTSLLMAFNLLNASALKHCPLEQCSFDLIAVQESGPQETSDEDSTWTPSPHAEFCLQLRSQKVSTQLNPSKDYTEQPSQLCHVMILHAAVALGHACPMQMGQGHSR